MNESVHWFFICVWYLHYKIVPFSLFATNNYFWGKNNWWVAVSKKDGIMVLLRDVLNKPMGLYLNSNILAMFFPKNSWTAFSKVFGKILCGWSQCWGNAGTRPPPAAAVGGDGAADPPVGSLREICTCSHFSHFFGTSCIFALFCNFTLFFAGREFWNPWSRKCQPSVGDKPGTWH